MKKMFSTFTICLLVFNLNTANAQTPTLEQITVDGVSINNCSTIAFGANTSVNLSLKMKVTKSASTDVGNSATFKLYIKKNASSTPKFINGIIVNNSAFWNNGTLWEGVFSQTLQAADIEASGSIFYGVYEITQSNQPKTCDYSLTKAVPSFTLSPTSLSLSCDDTSARTFTVTPANIPSGASLTYQWSNTGGWSGSSSTSSITLTPTIGIYLPGTVSVKPFLNGVAQQQLNCNITRATFTSSASINGANSICSPTTTGNYSLTGLLAGQTISWSSSNTSIATVSGTGVNAVVTKVSNGNFDLKATITNTCGQQFIVSKNIRLGGVPSSIDVIAVPTGGSYELSLTWPATITQGLTSVTWTKISGNGSCGGNGISGWADGSPTTAWTVTVKITATNDCGSLILYRTYSGYGYGDPCAGKIAITESVNKNIFIASKAPTCAKMENNTPIKDQELINVKVYDLSGNLIKEFKTNNFDLSDCKKGIYLINIITKDETSTTKVFVE